MRYRQLSPTGDYVFGQGSQNYLVDSPATVSQAVTTGLLLHAGEWFLNLTYGMPWETQVLSRNTSSLYDTAVKSQILNTQGVTEINSYSSALDPVSRNLTVNATISTIYSTQPVPLAVTVPVGGYGVFPYGTAGYGE